MKLKGRAGAYTFYSSKGRQIARVSQNATNYGDSARRSLAQQTRRVRWSNLVAFWKATGGVLSGSFETKRTNETDYNAFMRKNLPAATVAFTKDQAARGCCYPQAFVLSEGSLSSVECTWGTGQKATEVTTNITCGEGDATTFVDVYDLVNALVDNNPIFKLGTQLTLVTAEVSNHSWGPTMEFNAIELTMDLGDGREVVDVFGGIEVGFDGSHHLVFSELDGVVGVAVIISDSTSGKLKVSNSSLTMAANSSESQYSTPEAVAAAIESYGLDPDKFLDSGDFKG